MKRVMEKLANTWVDKVVSRLYAALEMKVMGAFHQDEGVRLIRAIRYEDRYLLCRPSEMYLIYSLALAQRDLEGDYAELGVYKGATAKLICEAKGDKSLHLFDTFEGLPEMSGHDTRFSQKMFSISADSVRKRLSTYQNVHIYQGLFPATGKPIENRRFAFVHLDLDIYQSTMDALDFFYSRLVPGGILITHDFPSSDGVSVAFTKFMYNKPEKIIGLPLSQGMIIKQAAMAALPCADRAAVGFDLSRVPCDVAPRVVLVG